MIKIKDLIIQYRNKFGNKLPLDNIKQFIIQDIILNKITNSQFKHNLTLKGGVLLSYITDDIRRTTTDIDLDVIKQSISNSNISEIIKCLSRSVPSDYKIIINSISKLNQQDYHGKRINITILDVETKLNVDLDIGVQNNEITQINRKIKTNLIWKGVKISIQTNSNEQIFVEKLVSLIKHNIATTRYKDIYDIYWFIKNTQMDIKLIKNIYYSRLKELKYKPKNFADIYTVLNGIFTNKMFYKHFATDKNKNWIGIDSMNVIEGILDFFEILHNKH